MSEVIILDGGMSRELMRLNAPFRQPEWSALALMEAPQLVEQVHNEFAAAGAQVLTTNSYALVPFHVGEDRFFRDGEKLAADAGRLARRAADAAGQVIVAGSLPPLFGSYEPDKFQAGLAPTYIGILVGGTLSVYRRMARRDSESHRRSRGSRSRDEKEQKASVDCFHVERVR